MECRRSCGLLACPDVAGFGSNRFSLSWCGVGIACDAYGRVVFDIVHPAGQTVASMSVWVYLQLEVTGGNGYPHQTSVVKLCYDLLDDVETLQRHAKPNVESVDELTSHVLARCGRDVGEGFQYCLIARESMKMFHVSCPI